MAQMWHKGGFLMTQPIHKRCTE